MTNLTSHEQFNEEKKMDQLLEKLENEENDLPENKAETIALTVFAVVIMGILLFLFKQSPLDSQIDDKVLFLKKSTFESIDITGFLKQKIIKIGVFQQPEKRIDFFSEYLFLFYQIMKTFIDQVEKM